jgi:hypothetical protein
VVHKAFVSVDEAGTEAGGSHGSNCRGNVSTRRPSRGSHYRSSLHLPGSRH